MTNTDLVKRLLDEDVLPYLSPEQVIDLCSEAAAAIIGLGSANKALKAQPSPRRPRGDGGGEMKCLLILGLIFACSSAIVLTFGYYELSFIVHRMH